MFSAIINFIQKLVISMFSGFANKRKTSDVASINITGNKKSTVKNVQVKNSDNKGKIDIKGNSDSEIEGIGIE